MNVCVKEAGVDFGSVQVRSRAVLAQEPENLQLCPDQVWESQPCTGECTAPATVALATSLTVLLAYIDEYVCDNPEFWHHYLLNS